MEQLPLYIKIIFILTLAATVLLFYKASNRSATTLIILISWIVVQGIIGSTGFYSKTTALPPRLALALAPPLLFIVFLFVSKKGRRFIDSLNIKTLTLLHIIRIPVEIVLLCLFIYKAVPQIMTFEGRNFDILSGISAPIVYYFAFTKGKKNKTLLLIWNLGCICLLANIVVIAILSAPYPFQQFAFDQPNTGLLYMPFIWLPAVIVPLVLLAHLASIRQLLLKKEHG